MTRRAFCAIQFLVALAAIGCSADPLPLTEMMVVVDSNIAQVDSVRVRVEGMGEPKVATAENLGQHPLPRTVAVVHRGGPLGPIEITAEALAGEATLVSRRAQVSFVRGRTLTLSLELDQSCVGMHCDAAAETCIGGSCVSAKVDSADLSEWLGKPRVQRDAGEAGDAGKDEAGAGSSGAGTGGQAGARTGGQGGQAAGTGGAKPAAGSGGTSMQATCTGCKFDSASPAPHGTLTCDTGMCLLSCDAGYTDADQVRGNGCEKATSAFPWTVSNVDPSSPSLMAALAPALTIDCSSTLDLSNAASLSTVDICGQQLQPFIVTQGGGAPDLVVFATRHLSVTAGNTLRFTGSRPVAILVYGDAVIDGEFDVSATGSTGGVGSNFECSPGAGGNGASAKHSGGGGGGGFGSKGGDGGVGVDSNAPPGQGGPGGVASAAATLLPLRGGCSGGFGGKGDGATAPGGGGGGALQISVAGKLRVAGTIAAAGGGGQPGSEFGDGGSGGGSGGAILLEATNIETVSGSWLTTNGGGGGEGRVLNNGSNAGADGMHSSIDVAIGGEGASSGGNGAAGPTPATAAPACTASLCGGGGGGGGIGRVVLRSDACLLGGSATPSTTCTSHVN